MVKRVNESVFGTIKGTEERRRVWSEDWLFVKDN